MHCDANPRAVRTAAQLEASDTKTYEPLGTLALFQLHNHPYSVAVAPQRTGAL